MEVVPDFEQHKVKTPEMCAYLNSLAIRLEDYLPYYDWKISQHLKELEEKHKLLDEELNVIAFLWKADSETHVVSARGSDCLNVFREKRETLNKECANKVYNECHSKISTKNNYKDEFISCGVPGWEYPLWYQSLDVKPKHYKVIRV